MQIGNLDDHYHFLLSVNVTLTSKGQPSANSKSLDHISDIDIGFRGEISKALSNFPKVIIIPVGKVDLTI